MTMKDVFLVTVSGHISQEAYATIDEAREFVLGRLKNDKETHDKASLQQYLISIVDKRNVKYQIEVVTVRGL